MPSGSGFLGGYGPIARSAYATPADLSAKPWTLDFTRDEGWAPFPTRQRVNPVALGLSWQTSDWDPGLRFWSLPFDRQLTEWLQDVDLASPAVMAAREFAGQHAAWCANDAGTGRAGWIRPEDLRWQAIALPGDPDGTAPAERAWVTINRELQELVDLMEDDRGRYLDEAWLQSDGIPAYFVNFLGIDSVGKPWTIELMRCGLAIGNLVYMHYKAHFKRVRPSTLCPGLIPPWGPPRHPAFPSGHSFLGHFIALLLMEIAPLAARFGHFADDGDTLGHPITLAQYQASGYGDELRCPLLWLAWRLARNRERIGVHYRSDSSASRSLAGEVWALVRAADGPVLLPSLQMVLQRARAEWPEASGQAGS